MKCSIRYKDESGKIRAKTIYDVECVSDAVPLFLEHNSYMFCIITSAKLYPDKIEHRRIGHYGKLKEANRK